MCFDLLENREKTRRTETPTDEAQVERTVLSPGVLEQEAREFPSASTVSTEGTREVASPGLTVYGSGNGLTTIFLFFFFPEPNFSQNCLLDSEKAVSLCFHTSHLLTSSIHPFEGAIHLKDSFISIDPSIHSFI